MYPEVYNLMSLEFDATLTTPAITKMIPKALLKATTKTMTTT